MLKKRAGFFSSWKNHTYVLKGDMLLEFKEGADLLKSPNRCIQLKNTIVRNADSLTGKDHTFAIFQTGGRSFFFQAPTAEEKLNWLMALGANVTEYQSPTSPAAPTSADSSAESSSSAPSSPMSPSSALLPILDHLEKFREAVLVVDDKNIIVAANGPACKVFACSAGRILGEHIDVLLDKPLRVEKLLEIGATHEIQAQRFDTKQVFDILLSMGRLQQGHLMLTITQKLTPLANPVGVFSKTHSSFF